MRRFFLSLLLLGIFGALLGAVLTWPEAATDVARNSPTLPEFQTGVRVFQPSAPSPVPEAQPEPIATGEMTLAAERLRHEWTKLPMHWIPLRTRHNDRLRKCPVPAKTCL